uniref:Uncharacterized protein n=1 Tax=Arundo donax TaxID=35708 RepID=A0A0A9BVV5_ARUDO
MNRQEYFMDCCADLVKENNLVAKNEGKARSFLRNTTRLWTIFLSTCLERSRLFSGDSWLA